MDLYHPLQAATRQAGVILGMACPHGPEKAQLGNLEDGEGRQWFNPMGWSFRDKDGLTKLIPQLNAYFQQILATHELTPAQLILAGFSQGSMTLLGALPQLNPQPRRVISLSGGLTMPPTHQSFASQNIRPPILFIHGQADDVWPADSTVTAEETYRQMGYPTQLELIPNLGHGIDAQVMAHMALAIMAD